MTDPLGATVPELLDAAAAVDDGGAAFGAVLGDLFTTLAAARDAEEGS